MLIKLIEEDNQEDEKQKGYKRTPIKFYINSRGGSVLDMWSICDIIINSATPIYTYCYGYAMSAGLLIFLSGHKRYISPHAELMYHQSSCWYGGTYADIVQKTEQLSKRQEVIEDFVLSRTKITKERLDNIRERKIDWYITPEEALKLGMVDEILNAKEVIS